MSTRTGIGPLRTAALAALALLCALQWFAIARAPVAWMPARVAVSLAAGQAVTLDAEALGAPRGTSGGLRLRRATDGHWWVAGAGSTVSVASGLDARARRTASAILARGQAFRIGTARYTVDTAGAGTVAFTGRGAHWRYDGAVLRRDGVPQPAARIAALWNRAMPSALTLARPLTFGGNLDCANRIAVAGLPEPGMAPAQMARGADGLLLMPGAAPLLLQDADGVAGLLAEREAPLDGSRVLVLGRTRYAVDGTDTMDAGSATLHLRPVAHVAVFAEAQQALPDGVAWTWTRRAAWGWPAAAPGWPLAVGAAAAALLFAAVRLSRGGGRRRSTLLNGPAAALLCGTGLTLLLVQRGGAFPGPGVSLLAACCALWFALLSDRRAGLATAAGVLLLAAGLLAQLDLGLGAPASSWLRHFHKSAAVLTLGIGATGLLRLWAPAVRLSQARTEGVLLLLAAIALLALLLQVLFGDETGVFDLQPVEFAKLALAALSAHCLALAGGVAGPGAAAPWRRLLRTLAPVLLFVMLLAVALVQVDDYSPLVLLLVWGATLALAAALGSGRRRLALLLVASVCTVVVGVAALRGAGPERIGEWSARWNFYPDRFMVWLDPATHPHTGQQVLLGARAVREGGWWGADNALGLRALGQDSGAALRIPAVQDDFAVSFFLHRHGLALGLGLWLLQALFLAGLLDLALRSWQASARARDFRAAWRGRLSCFCLAGGAAFAFGHFLLSWGTNLAILPVMGQPMSFLSAGGSHLLFFICPLLGLAAHVNHACNSSTQENDDARLRPA
jgi:cell division protein FtsW